MSYYIDRPALCWYRKQAAHKIGIGAEKAVIHAIPAIGLLEANRFSDFTYD